MKKVKGALRAMKAQVLLGGPGTRPPRIFFVFLTRSNMLFCPFEVSFTIIIGLVHM